MVRWNQEDLERFEQNSGRGIAPEALKAINAGMFQRIGRNKYGAHATVKDGVRFDSKLEADRYSELCTLERGNAIQYFLRQVPFRLPGNITYRLDFMVVYPIGIVGVHVPEKGQGGVILPKGAMASYVEYEDCKGFQDRVSINKIKQVEDLYGIKVVLLRRPARKRK